MKIALLNTPILKDKKKILEACLSRLKDSLDRKYRNDTPVALIYFSPITPHGCNGHPSVQDHGLMAAEVMSAFKKLLKE